MIHKTVCKFSTQSAFPKKGSVCVYELFMKTLSSLPSQNSFSVMRTFLFQTHLKITAFYDFSYYSETHCMYLQK